MKTLKLFKRSLLLLAVVALAALLTVGIVAGAATLSEGGADYGEEYAGVNVSVKGQVALRFYFKTLGTAEEFVAEITDPAGKTTSKTIGLDEIPFVTVGEGDNAQQLYRVSVPLAPSQMTYSVKLYANSKTNGAGKAYVYSVKEYAEDVIADPTKSDSHDAMRALLNWGAMAQVKFDESVDTLANEGIFARNTNPVSAVKDIEAVKPGVSSTNEEVFPTAGGVASANVYLTETDVAMGIVFPYNGSEKLTAKITRGDKVLTENEPVVKIEDGYRKVSIRNITATLYDDVYTVEVTDESGNTLTAQCSILGYIDYVIGEGSKDSNGVPFEAAPKNVCRAMYQFYQNVAEGAINAECAHTASMYWIDNGDETHSYKCADCFKQLSSVKVPAVASTYYTAFDIGQPMTSTSPMHPKSIFRVKTAADYSGNVAFTRVVGEKEEAQTSQLLWQRAQEDVQSSQISGEPQQYSVDVGNAQYFVFKAKSSTSELELKLNISTTGKSGPTKIATQDDIKDGHVNVNGKPIQVGDTIVSEAGYITITIPLNATNANEWGTYAIDLTKVAAGYYVKEGDSYKVDTLYFHFPSISSAESFDIAYMAFVEGDWDVLPDLIDTEKTIEIMSAGGVYRTMVSATGECMHGGTGSMAIVGGEHHYVCDGCGETLIDYNVPDSVEKYSPGIIMTNSVVTTAGTVTPTCLEENGVSFIRFKGMLANVDNWFGIDPSIGFGNKETGRYLVMKYRTNSAGVKSNSMQILASTKSGSCVGGAISTLYDAADNAWHTVVIDLATRITDPAGYYQPEAGTDDTYVLRYLQIRPFSSVQKSITADAYMDIEYIAVCDDINDVTDIVKQDTYELSVTPSATIVKNAKTHECVSHGYIESRRDNEDGTVSFISACLCGETRYTRDFPASSVVVYDPGNMNTVGTSATNGRLSVSTHYQMTNRSVEMESFPYFRFYGASNGVTQMLWQRIKENDGGGAQLYHTDVGSARFLVMKVRTSDSTVSWHFNYGTVGDGNKGTSIYVPFSSVKSNEWATYVIDLEEIASAYHKKTDGSYLVDNFYFTSGGLATDEYIDIAYFAFVEGDWSNVDELVEETSAIRVTDRANSYTIVDPSTGICSTDVHSYVSKSTTLADGSIKNEMVCSVCGHVGSSFTVPNYINFITTLDTMSNYNNAGTGVNKVQLDVVNGVAYNHFFATQSTHWNITGNGTNNYANAGAYTSDKYSTGEYIVIKYRAGSDAASTMSLFIGTGDKGKTNTVDNGANSIGTVNAKPEEGWKVSVVKIEGKEAYYTVGSEQTLYFMGMPGGARQIDIAYLAVVDSVEEAIGLLGDKETYFYHGNSLSNAAPEFDKEGNCVTHAIPTAETIDGTKHSVVCSACGETLRTYDVKDVNWYSPLGKMNSMNINDIKKNQYDEVNHLFYNRFTSTAGCHFLFTGGSGAGTWTTDSYATGNYVVIKYRAEATTPINFNVQTENHGEDPKYPGSNRPLYSNVGALQLRDMAGVGADGWRVAVVAIPDGINYTKGSNQRIYFQMTSGGGNTTLDIAYCAVIDSLDEITGLLGEGEGFYYHGTSLTTKPCEYDTNLNSSHTTLKHKTVGNSYQVVCTGCGAVTYDYKIDTSAAIRYRNDYQFGAYINYIDANHGEVLFDQLEVGSPKFSRFLPGTSTNPFGGDTGCATVNSATGKPNGYGVRYVVFKYRIGENNGLGQTMMDFRVKTPTQADSTKNVFQIPVEEDGKWHTIVIDLAARVSNGNYNDNNGDGYCLTYIGYHPFGDKGTIVTATNPQAYVDVAYIACCDTLENVSKLVGGDTYEWSVSDTKTIVRSSSTHEEIVKE